jgi:hypothetical protein
MSSPESNTPAGHKLSGGAPLQRRPVTAPGLEYLFRIEAEVGPALEMGVIEGVARRLVPILGGRVSGSRVNGKILAGGADWQLIRADGTAEVSAHYLVETVEGAIIEVENIGIRTGPSAILQKLLAGEAVDPALYYFRTTPRFRTRAPEYAFLTHMVCVCTGVRTPEAVHLNVFGLL